MQAIKHVNPKPFSNIDELVRLLKNGKYSFITENKRKRWYQVHSHIMKR